MSRLTRDGTAEPVWRDQSLRHARIQGNIIFHVQLTTSRIGNLTRLIHTLLYVMTIHSARTRAISLFKTSSRISSGVRAADRCEFSSFDCLLCSVGRLLPPPPSFTSSRYPEVWPDFPTQQPFQPCYHRSSPTVGPRCRRFPTLYLLCADKKRHT